MISTATRMTRSGAVVIACALLLGVAAAVAVAQATGVFAAPSTPVVSGAPLASFTSEAVFVSDYDGYYKGWARVARAGDPHSIHVAGSVRAYRWNGSSWVASSRRLGTHVYVWPYGSGWAWAWTEADGWMAMRNTDLLVRYVPLAAPT